MEDLKAYLTDKVLLFESDTLPAEIEKVLQKIRHEKPDHPVVYVSSVPAVLLQDRKRPLLR